MNRYLRHLPCAFFLLCTLAWVFPAVNETIGAMTDASQNMEYVWLVPVLAAAVLWARRKPLLASLGAPNPLAALPLILVAAAFFFLGARGGQSRFIQTAAVLLLLAAPLACYGKSAFKVAWFPIILLAFVMPVGFLDNFTVPLRKASVTVTAVILNGLGIEVHQQGTAIISTGVPPFQLDVADPCSGIRSLVALFVGTAAYGAFMLRGVWRRWALFLSSLPIAFLGNILRLLLTAFTCKLWGQSAGMVLHDNALFIVAPVYALCVFWLADRLRRNDKTEVGPPPPLPAISASASRSSASWPAPCQPSAPGSAPCPNPSTRTPTSSPPTLPPSRGAPCAIPGSAKAAIALGNRPTRSKAIRRSPAPFAVATSLTA